jgi:hypothetical protein
MPLVLDAARDRPGRRLGSRRVGVPLPGRRGRLVVDEGGATQRRNERPVMPASWVPSPAAGQDAQRYPAPRWQLDDVRLGPILDRLRELDAQARTVELIRITAWQGEAMLGTRLSTVHTALAVVTAAPLGATHLGLEGCGDLLTGDTWLPGYQRVPAGNC